MNLADNVTVSPDAGVAETHPQALGREHENGRPARRGLLMAVMALIGSAWATRRAGASTGDPLICGQVNQAESLTKLVLKTKGEPTHTNVFWAQATDKDSNGLRGDGSGAGAGVFGNCVDTGPGVFGISSGGPGIHGESPGPGGNGVEGIGTVTGVSGTSDKGFGVWATSSTGSAILGHAKGLSGSKAIAVDGRTDFSTQTAGYFLGKVYVQGSFLVTGAKSAAVPFPDGGLRQLYAVESPESWFEDFGEGKLVAGKAEVALDPGFASVVRGDYHVFLTPLGDSNGLFVARRDAKGFEVREQKGGGSTLAFSYRVVARRKDIEGARFAKVAPPAVQRLPANPAQRMKISDRLGG